MSKAMARRIIVCYFFITVAMFLVIMRVINVAFDPRLTAAAKTSSQKSVAVIYERGTIFDCNMKPITNNEERYVSVITDIPKASVTLSKRLGERRAAELLRGVREGSEPIVYTDCEIRGEGIVSFKYYTTNLRFAKHLIGYTDSTSHGVSGLEAALDEVLYSDSDARLSYTTDGIGNIISGEEISFLRKNGIEQSGIQLTLDSEIQKIAEAAADSLDFGAVVIAEAATGEIKAMVSRPDFDLGNLSAALNSDGSPLINRALLTYNVGSGFKPLVAAAALESGVNNYLWFCEGSCDIDGQRFVCHKSSGHKWLDMAGAIKHSCNTFFYNLAVNVGAGKIYKMAETAGFNNSVSLGYGFSSEPAQIGSEKWLSTSDRALANLAIGQGELMVSPLGILSLYSAIASDGSYTPLSLIRGRVEGAKLCDELPKNARVRLMSEKTAKTLREYLLGVLDEGGTGHIAKPKYVSAAGKTSTAQTGIIKDGKRVVNTWFCGFFPFDEPKYVVSVLAENSEEGCGAVFAEIADNITKLKASA